MWIRRKQYGKSYQAEYMPGHKMQFLNQLGQMLKMQSCHHISNLNRRNQCKNMVWYIRNLYKMLCCRREAMRLSICSWVQQYNTMRPLLVLLLVTSNKNLPMCTNNFCLSAWPSTDINNPCCYQHNSTMPICWQHSVMWRCTDALVFGMTSCHYKWSLTLGVIIYSMVEICWQHPTLHWNCSAIYTRSPY